MSNSLRSESILNVALVCLGMTFGLPSVIFARPVRVLSLFLETPAESSTELQSLYAELKVALAVGLEQSGGKLIERISDQALVDALPPSFDPTQCGERCPALIGGYAQADLYTTGNISKLENIWRVSVTIYDAKSEIALKRGRIQSALEADLVKEIEGLGVKWEKELHEQLLEMSQTPRRVLSLHNTSKGAQSRWTELDIEWVSYSGGSMEMGSDHGAPEIRPAHQVIVQPFMMMTGEVSAAQYWACVKAGACSPTPEREGCILLGQHSREAVNCVTWKQAKSFADWIGARLPSEIEWEFAARGKELRRYPWGDEEASCERLNYLDPVSGEGCGSGEPARPCDHPSGLTPEGLCDMGGNLWEWVQDDWHRSYHGAPDRGVWCDQAHLGEKACSPQKRGEKTYRGGSWYHKKEAALSTSRAGAPADTVSVGVGFRCVL